MNFSYSVSVIIPTYNRLAWLKEAVESVLSQTYPPLELMVVDDGSTDGTLDWLKNHPAKTLRYFAIPNSGPGVARNKAAALAQGEWLAFLDSDDYWLPQKLEAEIKYLKSHPDCQVIQSEEIWIRRGQRVNPKQKHQKPSGNIFLPSLKLCLVSPSAVLLKKDLFEKLGGFDPNFWVCEDYELWLRLSLQAEVMTLPEALVVKRGGHEDQLSRKFWGMDRFRVAALEKILFTQELNPLQKKAVLQEIFSKLEILAQGFKKRNPQPAVNPYEARVDWLKDNFTHLEKNVPLIKVKGLQNLK